jgi:hypothetical protein
MRHDRNTQSVDLKLAEREARRTQEQFWASPISRAEIFKNFQEISRDMGGFNDKLQEVAALVMYLVERGGVTQAEIDAWRDAKRKELLAAEKDKANGHATEIPADALPQPDAVPDAAPSNKTLNDTDN